MLHLDQWKRWKAACTRGAMMLPMCTSSPQRFPWPSCSIPSLHGGGQEEDRTKKGGSVLSSDIGWGVQWTTTVTNQWSPLRPDCSVVLCKAAWGDHYIYSARTRVRSRVPPQKRRRNRPRGSKCSSSPDGTCPSLGRNLGNQEER